MRVHVGVCNVEAELELEIEDVNAFTREVESAFGEGINMLWYDDTKGRRVGIPVEKIAFSAIEVDESPVSVGFG